MYNLQLLGALMPDTWFRWALRSVSVPYAGAYYNSTIFFSDIYDLKGN
jgi:hypothetical protein